jgi:hypothetical protein
MFVLLLALNIIIGAELPWAHCTGLINDTGVLIPSLCPGVIDN